MTDEELLTMSAKEGGDVDDTIGKSGTSTN